VDSNIFYAERRIQFFVNAVSEGKAIMAATASDVRTASSHDRSQTTKLFEVTKRTLCATVIEI
jgi:hypothetical protein